MTSKPLDRSTDFAELARRLPRAEFLAACPFYFLVSVDTLVRPRGAQRTLVPGMGPPMNEMMRPIGTTQPLPAMARVPPPPAHHDDSDEPTGLRGPDTAATAIIKPPQTLALAVRKVQEVFPSMITLGRTANNDIVVPDIMLSKFHAFFRIDGTRIEIADAGSRNGTFLGDRQLAANASVPIVAGQTVRFATRKFAFVGAGDCWDRVRRDA